jgi:hypothetical protein
VIYNYVIPIIAEVTTVLSINGSGGVTYQVASYDGSIGKITVQLSLNGATIQYVTLLDC